jgi:hypothetical protein
MTDATNREQRKTASAPQTALNALNQNMVSWLGSQASPLIASVHSGRSRYRRGDNPVA